MKLAEQLAAGPQPNQTSCQMRTIYDQLDDTDREALRSSLIEIRNIPAHNRSVSQGTKNIVWLTDILKNLGFTIGRTSISRHINGRCSCESI